MKKLGVSKIACQAILMNFRGRKIETLLNIRTELKGKITSDHRLCTPYLLLSFFK